MGRNQSNRVYGYIIIVCFLATTGTSQALFAESVKNPANGVMEESVRKIKNQLQAVPMTDDTDLDFALMMISLHQGVIEISEAQIKYGKNASLKKMAARNVNEQKRKIEFLQFWINSRQGKLPATKIANP